MRTAVNEALEDMHDSGAFAGMVRRNLGTAVDLGGKPAIGDLSFAAPK